MIPYLAWGGFYSLVNILRTLADGEQIIWKEVFLSLLFGKAVVPLYYILVMMQLMLLTPFIIKVIEYRGILWRLLWLLTPLWRLMIFILYPLQTGELPAGAKALFPVWFFFYYLGLHVQIEREFFYKVADKWGKRICVIGAVFICTADTYLQISLQVTNRAAVSQLRLSSFLYGTVVILWLLNCYQRGGFFNRTLYMIGNDSYAIYYVHNFVQMCVMKACVIVGMDRVWFIYVIICFAVMLVGSLSIIWAVRKMADRLGCQPLLKIFGFEK